MDSLKRVEAIFKVIYSGNSSKKEQKKRASKALQDPEIQLILMSPEIQGAIKAMETDDNKLYYLL